MRAELRFVRHVALAVFAAWGPGVLDARAVGSTPNAAAMRPPTLIGDALAAGSRVATARPVGIPETTRA